ncbi:MAG: hypothetical protein FWF53_12085 [Candidatus Azobacteroides sp.]|nr:hypothetical protein [Candidatus Azobacteroides sp.]
MNNLAYQTFLTEVQKAFSKKSIMIDTLADILRIEKGAVYRRIRQEVPFTFNEITVIAKYLGFSLDSIIGIEGGTKSVPFQLRLPDFISPEEVDYYILKAYIEFLQSLNQSESSEAAVVSNMLPHDLFGGYNHLLLFYLFIWNYVYTDNKMMSFHHISSTPEMIGLLNEFMMESKKFGKTSYIFDNKAFRIFVDRVNYFHAIRAIEKKDVSIIKEELLSLLDYLEDMAITGQFKETGKAVNLYIADIDISACYSYMETPNTHFSLMKAFLLSYVTSFDEDTFQRMKNCIQSLIKISTLITLTNEKQRVLYFEKQRKIVNEL